MSIVRYGRRRILLTSETVKRRTYEEGWNRAQPPQPPQPPRRQWKKW